MLRIIGKQSGESGRLLKAVTRGGCFGCLNPPKFQGQNRHTKTDLLLVTKFSKVTTGYPRYIHVFGSYK